MPIYGYRCDACGAEVEKRQSFHDEPLTTCETCGGSLRRVLHPVGIVFKGSGFYNTDNRKAAAAAAGTNSDGAKSNGENGEAGKSSSDTEKSTTPTSSADSSSSSVPAPAKTESSTATPSSTPKT